MAAKTVSKKRVEVVAPTAHVATFTGAGAAAAVKVVDEKPGPLSLLDKLKAYYKFLLAAVGAIVVIVNELTPVLGHAHWFTVAASLVTAVSVALKSNEHWVEGTF